MFRGDDSSYLDESRRPLVSLLFLLPWIAVYEAGVLMLSDAEGENLRNGADYWMRTLLESLGGLSGFLLPALTIFVLLTWHVIQRDPWRLRMDTQVGMLAESVLLALLLVAVGQLHHLVFDRVLAEPAPPGLLAIRSSGMLTRAVTFVGAGVYEEVMFRLLLVPAAFLFFRMFEFPYKLAAAMAALSTGFLFAMAHHVGPAADAFNLFTFSFRAAAGVFFASVFFLRGFGITVGAHAIYDLLVGVLLIPDVPSASTGGS